MTKVQDHCYLQLIFFIHLNTSNNVKGETLLHLLGNNVDFSSPLATGDSNIMYHILEIKGNHLNFLPQSRDELIQ